MIRIAAVGDVHYDRDSRGRIGTHLCNIAKQADVLLLAGDLTQLGIIEEAKALADDLSASSIPVVAVLGNHDYHGGQERGIAQTLADAGVWVLEGSSAKFRIRDCELGIAGVKGFGGGFAGACATEFGESEMKDFIRHTKAKARSLRDALACLHTPYKIALMHYSPIAETLLGEKREIYPFLGSYLLGEVADEAKVDVIFHGHAHKGVEKGATLGGIPVRNVAQPVIQHVCNVYTIHKDGLVQEQKVQTAAMA